MFRSSAITVCPQNIKDVQEEGNEQLSNSGKFSSLWKRTLLDNPHLDSNFDNPYSAAGNRVRYQEDRKNIQEAISKIGNRYGLYFFYSSSCPYCHEYSPILKRFAKIYHLDVVAISMDGGILPEWQKSRVNRGEAEALGVAGKGVPATLLFDSKTERVLSLGYGLLTMDALEDAIYMQIGGDNA